jgi:hypothetical protein
MASERLNRERERERAGGVRVCLRLWGGERGKGRLYKGALLRQAYSIYPHRSSAPQLNVCTPSVPSLI